ncbi:ABC transporter family substrate-binding protein [Nakamurella endophytica]|uniref:Peptide ABC transporter substrate-binding protein n=1 Tax=Nakamurella endophytica TaxID=1748367 RepID=A0A917SM52_9ACTN|nr:ABC transporter family substrate-binding protein [Nakamurella endophytica]GGL86504.1 peptide ABC transporter substrate-binding protein [Nakamurella endophytica]
MSRTRRVPLRLAASVLTLTLTLSLPLAVACTPPGLPPPIAPSAAATTATAPVSEGSVVVGMDGTAVGFNPHQIADAGPVSAAVAALVLPSVSTVEPDGVRRVNRDLVDSAGVTSTDPWTVTYRLSTGASWSDGTPVTAEDFSYLWDQMLVQPGTVDPAPYRLITAVRSLDAGKTVQVEFSAPVPGWASLFSPLLPSHILKDSPGGWATGLAGGVPVSANRYKLQSVDAVNGELTLVRNDKYWGEQPGPAAVVLRIGTPTALREALRRGDVQAVLVRPDAADGAALAAAVPAADRRAVPLPATVDLVFDTAAGPTRQTAVRRAVAQALDLSALRAVLTGGRDDGLLPVSSAVTLPSTRGAGTLDGPPVPTGDPAAAAASLTAAGWTATGAYLSRDGVPLRLVLSYPPGDPRMQAAAEQVQVQLGAAGIEVDLVRLSVAGIVAGLSAGTVQLALLEVPRVRSDAVAVASSYTCPPPVAGAAPAIGRGADLSGYCLSRPSAVQLLSEQADPATADAELWRELPALPIGQPVAVFATGAGLSGVAGTGGPGWTWASPLSGAPGWTVH